MKSVRQVLFDLCVRECAVPHVHISMFM